MPTLPLKIDLGDGKIKQFTSLDQLPNQDQINYLYTLIQRIILAHAKDGIVLQDELLLNELNNIKQ